MWINVVIKLIILLTINRNKLNRMPTAIVNTNVPSDKIKDTDVAKSLSKIVATTIGKPEQYVMTLIQTDQVMTYSGTQEPCAFVRIVSIGGLNSEKNVTISTEVCGLLESQYKIDPSRIYIEFVDSERHMFGWNSRTF